MIKRLFPSTILLAGILAPLNGFAQDAAVAEHTEASGVNESESAAADDAEKSDKAADVKEEKSAKNADSKDENAKDDDDKDWGVNADIKFTLGLGAFTKDEHARKIRSRFIFDVGGFYTIPVIDVSVHAETGFNQWLSKGGGSNGKYEFRWQDSNIGFTRNIWEYNNKPKEFSVSFDADLSFAIPTSKASWTTNLYTTITPTLSAGLKLGPLGFSYSITYGHNFHKYTSSTYDPSDVDILSRASGNELLGKHDIAMGGILNEIELVNKFAITYKFIKQLSLAVAFGFADFWTYSTKSNRENDEYVAKYAKVGRGHGQMSAGAIALSYTPIKYLTLTLGMESNQPWKTADQKTYRFPWFDTVSPSKNYTDFFFQIAGQY